MPRFYFDFHDGQQHHEDDEGCVLPDLGAARAIAQKSVRELRAESIKSGRTFAGCGFIIENEEHEPLAVIPFDDVPPSGH
jgi:hypothetical protein